MKVCKFGGSSLVDATQLENVCNIIKADPDRRVIIVSAPGKRFKEDIKVTDMLIACAKQRIAGNSASKEIDAVIKRFSSIIKDLNIDTDIIKDISNDLKARCESDRSNEKVFMDLLKSAGEDNCAKLVASALCSRNIDAQYISPLEAGLLLSKEPGNAQILPESYKNLASLRNISERIIFPGFFGHTTDGTVVTFRRGGSDITGAVLATALQADIYENFTDVDSVFSVNPAIVNNPAPISKLTYREMRELSYAGFNVLHDEAIFPLVNAGIPICIKNTNKPDSPGTIISSERKYTPGKIIGIASDTGFCTIFASKYLMNREVGFGRKLLQILEEEEVSYEHIPSGIDNISIIIRENNLPTSTEKHVLGRIKDELKTTDINIEHGLALIMIVGEGMRYSVGLAAKATNAFAVAKVNIEMMNQGSSEISMMFGVKSKDRDRAIRALYNEFFLAQ